VGRVTRSRRTTLIVPPFEILLPTGRLGIFGDAGPNRFPLPAADGFLPVFCNMLPIQKISRLLFACALIVLFAIDLEHQILPNVITVPGIVIGFLFSWFAPPGPWMSLAGIALGGGLLWGIAEVWFRLRKVEAMGFGDVKMLAMIGAFLGVKLVVLTFVLSSMIGGLVGATLLATRRADMATKVPFGTMLAFAALVASLYGEPILTWYFANL